MAEPRRDVIEQLVRLTGERVSKRWRNVAIVSLSSLTLLYLLFVGAVRGGPLKEVATQMLATLIGAFLAVWVGRSAAVRSERRTHDAQVEALKLAAWPFLHWVERDCRRYWGYTAMNNVADAEEAKKDLLTSTQAALKNLEGIREAYTNSALAMLAHYDLVQAIDYARTAFEEDMPSLEVMQKELDRIGHRISEFERRA